ncbi:MAG: nuclear transport factor 2 family protein [Candidatus Thorarchaeota archaeon]
MEQRKSEAIQEVLQIEENWTEAHRQMNLDIIESIMADDYMKIQHNGNVIAKSESLAWYRSIQHNWESARSDQYNVRIYGDTAVVIGRWNAKGTTDGRMFDYSARFMSVYVKRMGRWQMVAEQSTPISSIE